MLDFLPEQVKKHPRRFILLAIIVIAGTFFRVWKIDTHAIFFGDAGHDLLAAREAIDTGKVPLLGIESSKPELRQGPVAIWINVFSLLLFGNNLLAVSIIYALMSVFAIIGLYELVFKEINAKAALVASTLLSLSPLAIAHGRMPYHTTPIPFFSLLYVWSLVRLWHKKPHSLFWAFFAWAILFQFELATFPLILPIFYVLYQQKMLAQADLRQPGLALGLGLLPQIIYDLTHGLEQLGGFITWVGYRTGSSILGSHQISSQSLSQVIKTTWLWLGRFFSVDQAVIAAFGIVTLVFALTFSLRKIRDKKAPPLIELSLVSFVSLLAAFVIHGSPSEAYYPPFFILMPILISFLLSQLGKGFLKVALVAGVIWAGINFTAVLKNNFFLDTNSSFSYGYSVLQQKSVLGFISRRSDGFVLRTTRPTGKHEKYFDNFKWLMLENNLPPMNPQGQHFFIEPKDSPLNSYPNMIKVTFPTLDVYSIFQ